MTLHIRSVSRRFLLLVLVLCGAPAGVAGQVRAGEPAPAQPPAMDSVTAPRPQIQQGISPLLDRPVSRTEYVLGPADILTLSIFGFRSESFNLAVSPEGSVVIPTVGVAQVGGLNIEQAEAVVARRVRRIYQDVEVNLTLAAVRSFKVFVVGEVENPGVREATAVTRVSEIIPRLSADGITHRNIVVRRANGETLQVDLALFLQTGDLEHNPTLREGDLIQVPSIDATVRVHGTVALPGTYAYRPGETLADLLRIANAGGPFPADAADTLRLMRFSHNPEGEILTISRAEALTSGMRLEPFDALYVPQVFNLRSRTTATIEGEVRRPGSYPIQPNVTTVRELVRMAGGFTPEASLLDATLRREPVSAAGSGAVQLESLPPELLSPGELRILQVTRMSDERNVVIDFSQLFTSEGSAYDLTLEGGDNLYVPEHRNEITVLGAVLQPGILAYNPVQPIEFFIDLAGGYTRRADRNDIVVLTAQGTRLHRDDVTTLQPGDRIIVPFKEPKTILEHMQTVQVVIGAVSGLVLTVVGLESIFDMLAN